MNFRKVLLAFLVCVISVNIQGQTEKLTENLASTSDYLSAFSSADRSLFFSLSDSGVQKPIIWGLDLAWLNEGNIRRGIAFMDAENVDIIRSSFTPTAPLVEGKLQAVELGRLNERLTIINKWFGSTNVVLNCDHPSVDPWFSGNAYRWAQLIDVTAKHHEEAGHTVVTVSPFNEPDYGWGQGNINDFYNIAGELRKISRFDNVRISGGNTLNADQALVWYNGLKSQLDEGNTHQLAGSFANYAAFYESVRANGHHATNDELHNVMEAMVGVEYGLQTGIWWGTAEFARGEFVKASDGRRLAYAEHRPNWTAASVYRNPDGKVQAFGGSSERQAVTTSYKFVSTDHDVFFNGYGPQREYIMEIPGGLGYQQGQTNAERVVNITWGDDIQPVVDGRYVLVNRKSGKVMEVTAGSQIAGAGVRQAANTGASHQQWNVKPVSPRIGGDFSYFTITAEHSGKALDILNWSLENGGDIIVWDDAKGDNQQWYLDYAEDGWFYIRSRHSAKCLDVYNASTINGAKIVQWEKNEGENQQWRFLLVDAAVEFDAPDKPQSLRAKANAVSVRLDWTASSAQDVDGYVVFRSDNEGVSYKTIARNVEVTSFVDNTTEIGKQYFYAVKAVDFSLNRSEYSNEVSATANGENGVVAHFYFENNTLDSSANLNHAASYGDPRFIEGVNDSYALELNGEESFLQLPANLTNHNEITIASWVNWNGGASWQRIFDFGNSQDEYMYLTPRMRFAIKNEGSEQRIDVAKLPVGVWSHVAVSINDEKVCLYFNGELVEESNEFTIKPLDIKPIFNYIGRGQFDIPLFDGAIDDFTVYNYALTSDELNKLYEKGSLTSDKAIKGALPLLTVWPLPATDILHVDLGADHLQQLSNLSVFNAVGVEVVVLKNISNKAMVDVSILEPGFYILKVSIGEAVLSRKIIISR
ncbi:MAG: RICIN domain-containing protein [Prolixibacteraceae bacterium]|jgi:hypothetical protein|nr:RICIN domain-containing protein [Prolixibacteraceae bacterium]